MGNNIKIRVKTLSNMVIGGTPRPFEIGGIDQWTAVDEEGFPCIPASSLKGALRVIVKEDMSEKALEIVQYYKELLKREKEENEKFFQKRFLEQQDERKRMGVKDEWNRMEIRCREAEENASACDLFGIREFNNTPKLLFNDLRLIEECRDLKKCFSIDTKTAIVCTGDEPKSNPRTYKAVRKGMEFEGEIEFYRFDQKYFDEQAVAKCREFLIENLEKFNDGIYRLGGSKSRGYGKVHITILEDGGEEREKL